MFAPTRILQFATGVGEGQSVEQQAEEMDIVPSLFFGLLVWCTLTQSRGDGTKKLESIKAELKQLGGDKCDALLNSVRVFDEFIRNLYLRAFCLSITHKITESLFSCKQTNNLNYYLEYVAAYWVYMYAS